MSADPASNLGSHHEWNAIWSTNSDRLFSRGGASSLRQFWHQSYFEDLWALIGRASGQMNCVELGAGRGTTSMYLADRGCDVTLVDLAPSAFDLARKEFSAAGLPLPRCVQADAAATGLPTHSFDCAYSIGVLEHFEDPLPILREACRLLKPGGVLFQVIVPESSYLTSLPTRFIFAPWRPLLGPVKRWLAGAGGRGSMDPAATMVRVRFTDEDWNGWMRDLGHSDIRCIPYNPYPAVYANPIAERLVSLPAFKLHRRMMQASRAGVPALASSPAFSFCQLLSGRTRS